jgi:hypothetical protein
VRLSSRASVGACAAHPKSCEHSHIYEKRFCHPSDLAPSTGRLQMKVPTMARRTVLSNGDSCTYRSGSTFSEAEGRFSMINHTGGEVIAHHLTHMRHVQTYSVGNRILIDWQAPGSRRLTSRPAFEGIAGEQGHDPRRVGSSTSAARIRRGSKAVGVWVVRKGQRIEEDPETGEEFAICFTYFRPDPRT